MTTRDVYKTLHVPRLRRGIHEGAFFASGALALLIGNATQSPVNAAIVFGCGYSIGWLMRDEPGLIPIVIRALRVPRRYDAGRHVDTVIRIIPTDVA